MAIDPELERLKNQRKEQKLLLDELLKGKSEEERIAVKLTKEYKTHANVLKEINEQVKQRQYDSKIIIDNIIQEQNKIKGLTGLQSSLVSLEKVRIANQQSLNGDIQTSINSISSLNQELLSYSNEDSIARNSILNQIDEELQSLKDSEESQKSILNELIKQSEVYSRYLTNRGEEIKISNEEIKKLKQKQNIYNAELVDLQKRKEYIKQNASILSDADKEEIKSINGKINYRKKLSDVITNSIRNEQEKIEDIKSTEQRIDEINRNIESQTAIVRDYNKAVSDIIPILEEQRNIASGISSLSERQQKILNNQISIYEGIKDTIHGVIDTVDTLTSGLTNGLGMAIIGAGIFVDKMLEMKKVLGQMPPISTAALSFFDENAIENAKSLANQFGGIRNVTFDMQLSTTLLSKNLGISGDEAASLLGTFSRLNGGSVDIAKNLMVSTKEFAKQNGIIPADLMKDLANNTEAFALYTNDGGKNIIKAAAYARKLGVEFDKLTGIADNLLDFETSITKELELGAMLGRNINLNKARELAYSGNIEEATKETLRVLGGVDAFNRMDVFAKKAAADLLGVQVSELAKMVNNQNTAAEQTSFISEKYSTINEAVEAIGTEWGGGILKGLGSSIIVLGQVNMGLTSMGLSVGKIGKGILSAVGGMVKLVFQAGLYLAISTKELAIKTKTWVGDKINNGILLLKTVYQKISNSLSTQEFLTKTKTWVGDKINNGILLLKTVYQKISTALSTRELATKRSSWLMDKLSAGWELIKLGYQKTRNKLLAAEIALQSKKSAATTAGNVTGSIAGGMNATSMLKGAAAVLVLAGAMFVAAKAFQQFSDVSWSSVGMGITTIASLALVSMLLGNAGPAVIKGALAVAILGAALIPLAYALNLAAPAIEAFGTVITSVFSGLGKLVTSIASGFVMLMDSVSIEKIGNIFLLGSALLSASVGLTAFAIALASASISSFFGGGVFKEIERLSSLSIPLLSMVDVFDKIGNVGNIINTIIPSFNQINTVISELVSYNSPINDLTNSLFKLSTALTSIGLAGIIASPALMAITGIKTLSTGITKLNENNQPMEDNSELINTMKVVVDEIKGLRNDLKSGKIGVYMDGSNVASKISKVVDRLGVNSY